MFNNPPVILSHKNVLDLGNFVVPEFIINKSYIPSQANLFHRFCPHRRYPLHEVGEITQDITCNFHNFLWDQSGTPINNNKKLHCGTADIGRSGLVFKNFKEPTHFWVDTLSQEKDLVYSHTVSGKSTGSWLWVMDSNVDIWHVHDGPGSIHPELAKIVDLSAIEMYEGDGWVLQNHPFGWWLFIFPHNFIEWSPGCLHINYTVPDKQDCEFGFDWISQFYFTPEVSLDTRKQFETLVDVFRQDIQAVEKQKGPYFPLINSANHLEDHCVVWGEWFQKHRKT